MVHHHLGYNTKFTPPFKKKLTFPSPHSSSMIQFSNQFGNEMVVKDCQKKFKIANKSILFYFKVNNNGPIIFITYK
jgi:hypothetical protein